VSRSKVRITASDWKDASKSQKRQGVCSRPAGYRRKPSGQEAASASARSGSARLVTQRRGDLRHELFREHVITFRGEVLPIRLVR
jgi:hypothetical protein